MKPKPKASASVGVKATLRPVPPKNKKTHFGANSSKGTTRK